MNNNINDVICNNIVRDSINSIISVIYYVATCIWPLSLSQHHKE